MVLLDMMSKTSHRLIVAHVDHGIREDSADDARFVAALAKRYRLPFISTQLELGKEASEERARKARYDFLLAEAAKHSAIIVTAHHLDDMVETIALNLTRGTGWRGLAVLDRAGLYRPLLQMAKQQLYDYALTHHLEWVEDSTNHSDRYLRNRLRAKLARANSNKQALSVLRARQLQLRKAILHETNRLIARHSGSRYFLTQLDTGVAVELFGEEIYRAIGVRPTRPQLMRGLVAVKTAQAGTVCHVGDRMKLMISVRKYQISVL